MKPGLTLLTALLLWQTGLQPVRSFQYELEGYFDKDEQGWCASRIEIRIGITKAGYSPNLAKPCCSSSKVTLLTHTSEPIALAGFAWI